MTANPSNLASFFRIPVAHERAGNFLDHSLHVFGSSFELPFAHAHDVLLKACAKRTSRWDSHQSLRATGPTVSQGNTARMPDPRPACAMARPLDRAYSVVRSLHHGSRGMSIYFPS
jgi:hypothetical protein